MLLSEATSTGGEVRVCCEVGIRRMALVSEETASGRKRVINCLECEFAELVVGNVE